MDIKKKLNITVFGPTSKIGLELTKKYLDDGNILNLFYRNRKAKISLKKNSFIKKKINQVRLIKYNFSNLKTLKLNLKKNKDIINKTEIIIITTAEQGEIKNFFKQSIKKFYDTFYTNFFFYVLLFKNINQFLNKKKKLLIILFSGGGSTSYRENFSSYSLTKICLVKLTEILSHEIKNKNIRFNILSPGIIESPMTKKILREKNKVSKKEILKLKRNIKFSDINIYKLYKTINFLNSKKGNKISGKLISSAWDDIAKYDKKTINKLINSDKFTLRRKEFN